MKRVSARYQGNKGVNMSKRVSEQSVAITPENCRCQAAMWRGRARVRYPHQVSNSWLMWPLHSFHTFLSAFLGNTVGGGWGSCLNYGSDETDAATTRLFGRTQVANPGWQPSKIGGKL